MADASTETYPPPDYDSDGALANCQGTKPAPLSFRELMALQRRNVAIENKGVAAESLQKQWDKDRSTARPTGSHLRPLAEPPIMPWTSILREEFSDTKLSALFPDSAENRSRAKDVWGELLALSRYLTWAQAMGKKRENLERKEFYLNLVDTLKGDFELVRDEWYLLHAMATTLGRFEYKWLDMDGNTKHLEHELRKGSFTLDDESVEVKAKYGHLAPAGYSATPVGMFEYEFLRKGGSTSEIEKQIWVGNNIFAGRPDEVKNKYRYLFAHVLADLGDGYLNRHDDALTKERKLRRGALALFTRAYDHLPRNQGRAVGLRGIPIWRQPGAVRINGMPLVLLHNTLYPCSSTLQIFEDGYLDDDSGTLSIEKQLRAGVSVFQKASKEVREEYAHLMQQYTDISRSTFFYRTRRRPARHSGTQRRCTQLITPPIVDANTEYFPAGICFPNISIVSDHRHTLSDSTSQKCLNHHWNDRPWRALRTKTSLHAAGPERLGPLYRHGRTSSKFPSRLSKRTGPVVRRPRLGLPLPQPQLLTSEDELCGLKTRTNSRHSDPCSDLEADGSGFQSAATCVIPGAWPSSDSE